MPITAAAIASQISELRSKIAVYRVLSSNLLSNYLESDAGAAEMNITREDGAVVLNEHVEAVVAELSQRISDLEEVLTRTLDATYDLGEKPQVQEKKPAKVKTALPAAR